MKNRPGKMEKWYAGKKTRPENGIVIMKMYTKKAGRYRALNAESYRMEKVKVVYRADILNIQSIK